MTKLSHIYFIIPKFDLNGTLAPNIFHKHANAIVSKLTRTISLHDKPSQLFPHNNFTHKISSYHLFVCGTGSQWRIISENKLCLFYRK